MTLASTSAATERPTAPTIRKIGVADLRAALRQGFDDFLAMRGDLLVLGLIYPAVGLIASAVILRNALAPLAFPLAAGLSLMGPAVACGFYELARRRERGEDSDWRHFFDIFRGRARWSLTLLTVALAVLMIGWLLCAWAIYQSTLGAWPMSWTSDFLRRLFTTPEGWALIMWGNLAGLAFAVATLAISVVSFPMLVDRPVDPITAVETSLRVARANPGTIASWGAIVGFLLVLGSIPLFIGLAVVLPVLGYASWHLYTRVVAPGG